MKVKAPPCLGATPDAAGTHFAVWSAEADSVVVCLFDAEGAGEERRVVLAQDGEGVHHAFVEGVAPGARYGLRADGPYNPGGGWWFDPNKLLVDPYALAIDRPYVYDPRLTLPRDAGVDTAPLMPKGVVCPRAPRSPHRPPLYQPGGLIYEIPVRAFTHRHPDLPEALRGTIGALAKL